MICDSVAIDLELCDTAGQEDLQKFRSTAYYETDVFIVCFSIVCPKSFDNVSTKWIPEIKECLPNKPILLVGEYKSIFQTNTNLKLYFVWFRH
jgi:small GTP-binding protein